MSRGIDMEGVSFGTVRVGTLIEGGNQRLYAVTCSACGSTRPVPGGNIRRAEKSGASGCPCTTRARKHGLWEHPLYKTWAGMLARCCNPRHIAFPRYGGRGITVCSEWKEAPEVFILWAERHGWERGKEVDRKDNDAGYSPDNCRVVDTIVNANNRSNNRTIRVGDEVLTVAQASRRFGIKKTTIRERLNRGWADDQAVREVRK